MSFFQTLCCRMLLIWVLRLPLASLDEVRVSTVFELERRSIVDVFLRQVLYRLPLLRWVPPALLAYLFQLTFVEYTVFVHQVSEIKAGVVVQFLKFLYFWGWLSSMAWHQRRLFWSFRKRWPPMRCFAGCRIMLVEHFIWYNFNPRWLNLDRWDSLPSNLSCYPRLAVDHLSVCISLLENNIHHFLFRPLFF